MIGSLENTVGGARFAIKNRLSDAEPVGLGGIRIDGDPVALAMARTSRTLTGVNAMAPESRAHGSYF